MERASRQAHVHHLYRLEIHLFSRRTSRHQEFYRRFWVGAATFLSHLAPFVLLASTLRMAMTQGMRQGLVYTQHVTASPWSGTLQLSLLQNACLVSRVSFAADTCTSRVSLTADPRPSGESSWMRAFHSVYIPPVPALPSDNVSDDGSGSLSPRETQGPLTLTPEDIRARINGNRPVSTFRLSVRWTQLCLR